MDLAQEVPVFKKIIEKATAKIMHEVISGFLDLIFIPPPFKVN